MSPLAEIYPVSPTDSTVSPQAWKGIEGVESGDSQPPEFPWTMWGLHVPVPLGATTMCDVSSRIVVLEPGYPEEGRPWYQEAGMEGMRVAVDRMRREAMGIEATVGFSEPVVEHVGDDEGDELCFVVVDVFIPERVDGRMFRDRLFDRLVQVLAPDDRARLAVGVGRLDPLP